MNLRADVLAWLSLKLATAPNRRTVSYDAYHSWREESLSQSWQNFAKFDLDGKDVLDFGCGDGELSLFLAERYPVRKVIGVDLNGQAVARAQQNRTRASQRLRGPVEFIQGAVNGVPVPDASVDVIVAFDCLEHVMKPLPILKEWARVLRGGGSCLVEWYPFRGPWGPHMESLIPVPWAHVLFGETAMFRAAERIYDDSRFVPRHWDLLPDGTKKPNKWCQWSTFAEQGYINELDVPTLKQLVSEAGLRIGRLEQRSFGGSPLRRALGGTLKRMPLVGEYFVSYTVIELSKA